MQTLPIIKLEVDHMRHAMSIALSDYHMQMDQYIQESLEKFCTPENLRRIIDEEARRVLDSSIRDAVRSWFLTSEEGQSVIKKYIAQKLSEEAKLYGGADYMTDN